MSKRLDLASNAALLVIAGFAIVATKWPEYMVFSAFSSICVVLVFGIFIYFIMPRQLEFEEVEAEVYHKNVDNSKVVEGTVESDRIVVVIPSDNAVFISYDLVENLVDSIGVKHRPTEARSVLWDELMKIGGESEAKKVLRFDPRDGKARKLGIDDEMGLPLNIAQFQD